MRKRRGRVEHALLLFLYNTGARASEAASLKVSDLQTGGLDGRHALAVLHGKDGRVRHCPLWPRTEQALAQITRGRKPDDAVFVSQLREPYTRFGVYRVVERHAAAVPSLAGRKVTPHVLRHTCACHLLRAGVDLNTIRAWLGHVSLDTTNIYAQIDFETKRKAMNFCDLADPEAKRCWKDDPGLMGFLDSLC